MSECVLRNAPQKFVKKLLGRIFILFLILHRYKYYERTYLYLWLYGSRQVISF